MVLAKVNDKDYNIIVRQSIGALEKWIDSPVTFLEVLKQSDYLDYEPGRYILMPEIEGIDDIYSWQLTSNYEWRSGW